MLDATGGVFAIVGCALVALAGLGAIRFGDVFARIHAATKASTLGILLIATGAVLRLRDWEAGVKLALAVSLVFLTAPVAAHLVGRAAYPSVRGARRIGEVDELEAALDADPPSDVGDGPA